MGELAESMGADAMSAQLSIAFEQFKRTRVLRVEIPVLQTKINNALKKLLHIESMYAQQVRDRLTTYREALDQQNIWYAQGLLNDTDDTSPIAAPVIGQRDFDFDVVGSQEPHNGVAG